MAWEWVAPVVTGFVGVAGITATYATGRQARIAASDEAKAQREAARAQRNHDEKRTAYLNLLQAISDALAAEHQLLQLVHRESVDTERTQATYREAFLGLTRARDYVRLVGSRQVRAAALALENHAQAMLTASQVPGEPRFAFDHELDARLVAEMKRDLEHELADEDLAALGAAIGEADADSLRTGEAR